MRTVRTVLVGVAAMVVAVPVVVLAVVLFLLAAGLQAARAALRGLRNGTDEEPGVLSRDEIRDALDAVLADPAQTNRRLASIARDLGEFRGLARELEPFYVIEVDR